MTSFLIRVLGPKVFITDCAMFSNISNLVKEGKTSKEIAELMNLSKRTVEFHRDSIRKKIGIKNKKANLRAFLISLS